MRLIGLSRVPILRGSWVVTSGDYKSPGMVCNFGCSTANPTQLPVEPPSRVPFTLKAHVLGHVKTLNPKPQTLSPIGQHSSLERWVGLGGRRCRKISASLPSGFQGFKVA